MADPSAGTRADLGDELRRRRKGKGWTQGDVAKEAAVALTLVGKAERGQHVSDTTLRAIARALDVPDAMVDPHLTEQTTPTRPRLDPSSVTAGDIRREFAYFAELLSKEDFLRLLDFLDMYSLDQRPRSS